MKGRKAHNLVGRSFSRLTVVAFAGIGSSNSYMWRCKCACGTEKIVRANNLRNGTTQSCGCLQKDLLSARDKVTHGLTGSPEYVSWAAMKTRCLNEKVPCYQRYGGRGITICQRWMDSFEDFLFDMGKRPTMQHSLDRIDVNGNYEPNNCKWSTKKEQRANQRK